MTLAQLKKYLDQNPDEVTAVSLEIVARNLEHQGRKDALMLLFSLILTASAVVETVLLLRT